MADLFKSNPLVIIAADERDVVGVRSNIRGEDVQLYRLRTPPDAARKLLLEYVVDANALVDNAGILQFDHDQLHDDHREDDARRRRRDSVRLAPDRQWLSSRIRLWTGARSTPALPLPELRALAHIDERAQAAGLSSPDFSRLIRVGVPSPRE